MKVWRTLGTMAAALGVAAPVHATTVPTDATVIARYDFDAARTGGPVTDLSGHGHTLTPAVGHGGKAKLAGHAKGHAVAFPADCKSGTCPHAVLQAPDAPELSPGANPIRWGATVKLARAQTGKGENILQKGYSAEGSQYKLQVDGKPGRPSCVMTDNAAAGIHVAHSDISIADGTWHSLECRRSGATLTLLVDGAVHATAAIPATLAVTNTAPLSLGGKGDGVDNDQFHGSLDDVWIALG